MTAWGRTPPCWVSLSSPQGGDGHRMDLVVKWYHSGKLFLKFFLLRTHHQGKKLALVSLMKKSWLWSFQKPIVELFLQTILAVVQLKVTDLSQCPGKALARKPPSFIRTLDQRTPHPETGWSRWLCVSSLDYKRTTSSINPTHLHTMCTHRHPSPRPPLSHMLVRADTHSYSLILPTPLYLGVTKAEYLRARGKYGISCMNWDISLPVLLINLSWKESLAGKW